VDQLKLGLLGNGSQGFDLDAVLGSFGVLVPVGLGVLLGVVGVSNLLKWLMERYAKATLGVLLGLLLGAVVGLYPFRTPTLPGAGFVHRGQVLDSASAAVLDPKYWPLETYAPSPGQVLAAIALVLAGFGVTLLVARIGSGDEAVSSS
jgi:hypothetical protein